MKTKKGPSPRPLAERFWEKVEKTPDCWEWTGHKDKDEYGRFKLRHGVQDRSHRVAWKIANGDIPSGLSVLHKCDNPSCVRPDHLYAGTQQQNEQDKASRGRVRNRFTPSPIQGLDAEKVMQIRADSRPDRVLAKEYGVSHGTIWSVRARRTWGNIP